MTELLQRAIAEVLKLPPAEQEELAAWILDELASERRWQNSFDNTKDQLARLAEEVLAEDHRHQTQDLDPDKF